jgi:hypothetical protein
MPEVSLDAIHNHLRKAQHNGNTGRPHDALARRRWWLSRHADIIVISAWNASEPIELVAEVEII